MDKGAMWMVVFVMAATVSGGSQEANSITYLEEAMTGFDPFYMSCLKLPNPGRRSKIFQPLDNLHRCPSDDTVFNTFFDEVQDTNNLPAITIQKVANLKQYIEFTAFSAYELSSDTNFGAPYLRYENYSSYETRSHQRDHAMFQFFKDTGGEVLFAKSDTVTHTITISPFELASFTPAFQRAIVTLYDAALSPISKVRDQTFSAFIEMYGTHFSRRTLLGSRVIFGKLFSSRAATVEEETDRRRCVQEAAREALTPCTRGCNETTDIVFARASSERCGGEEHEAIVAVTGSLPERSLEDWASAAKHSPHAIVHQLEPLSNLFNTEWFTEYFETIQIPINGSLLSQQFEDILSDYNSRMVNGGWNKSLLRGCGLNSDCLYSTECLDEPDTMSGFSCVPNEEATTTTTTSTTTTIPTTTTPAPTTTTMRPCPTVSGAIGAVVGNSTTVTSHTTFGSSDYPNDSRFSKTIVAPPGHRVRVRIQTFHTEADFDYLFFYDGSTSSFTPMAVLSGDLSAPLPTYTSSGCAMLVKFRADHSSTKSGFSFLYDAVA